MDDIKINQILRNQITIMESLHILLQEANPIYGDPLYGGSLLDNCSKTREIVTK